MALTILAGFIMAKAKVLPRESNKGLSLVTMVGMIRLRSKGSPLTLQNLALPCLIFASMVSAFTPENVKAFGPLVLCAVMYQILGGLLAWLVTEVCYVPADFRWGILVVRRATALKSGTTPPVRGPVLTPMQMGVISNWGNLPTAVVQTMAKEAPFDPATDVDLGVAYIA